MLKKRNLPIHYVTSKDLREFTTTEKDFKKGNTRLPTPNYLTTEENLFPEEGGSAAANQSQESADEGVFANSASGQSDLAAQQMARGKQLTVDVSADRSGSELSDADSSEVRQSMAGGAAAIFARSDQAPASL